MVFVSLIPSRDVIKALQTSRERVADFAPMFTTFSSSFSSSFRSNSPRQRRHTTTSTTITEKNLLCLPFLVVILFIIVSVNVRGSDDSSPKMHSKCIPLSPVVLRFNGDTKRSSACKERKRRKRCPRFSAFAFSAASEDEKETGQRNFGETVVVVTGCLGFIGSNLVSHLLERRTNNRSQDDDENELVTVIGIDVLDVEKGPYKKEDKRANLNRLMQHWEEKVCIHRSRYLARNRAFDD